jgi:hypothetical protein
VDAVTLAQSPKVEHLFKPIGGKEKALEFLAGSEALEARKILELHDRLNLAQKAAVPFEAYCCSAGISPKRAFGIVCEEASDQSAKAVDLLAKVRHPEVLEATIDNALRASGVRDREMIHKAQGFVPVPKTSVTNFFGRVDARTQTANVAVLPPVEDGVRRLSDRFNDALDAAAPVRMIEATEEDEEEEE